MGTIMQTLQPITVMDWKHSFSKDKEVIEYFDHRLKQLNPKLSVNTFIGELIEIFPIKKEWAAHYIDGLFSASDKDRFKDRFKADLLATIETGENMDDLNRFRKFGFESCEAGKGQKIQLGALGYMFFVVPTMEGNPTGKPKPVSYFNDAVYSIGEGATMEKFIFSLFSVDEKMEDQPSPPTKINTGFTKSVELMAWIYRLGVIDAVLDATKENEEPKYSKAGKIISTFTNIDPGTARKAIEAMKKPSHSKNNPNPLEKAETQRLIDQLANEYKLNLLK